MRVLHNLRLHRTQAMSLCCTTYNAFRSLPRATPASLLAITTLRISFSATRSLSPNKQCFRSSSSAMSSEPTEQTAGSHLMKKHDDRIRYPPFIDSSDHDPTKPSVDILIDNEGTLQAHNLIISSAVKKPSSLIAGLSDLLRRSKDPMDGPSTPYWILEPTNDAITRIFAFRTQDQTHLFRDRLTAVSDEMDHHARVRLEGPQVTVTCTTHRPPGLSMRDIRLARRVNELAAELDLE